MLISFIATYLYIAFNYFIERPLKLNKGGKNVVFIILPTVIISSLLVGLRPLTAGNDTIKYVTYYKSLQGSSWLNFWDVYSLSWETDYLYNIWNYLLSWLGVDVQAFIYITAVTSILLFLLALRKLVGKDYLLVFLFFMATPGFVAMFGNAIRQGLALPFFLFTLAYCYEKKWIKMILFALITLFLHNSTGVFLILGVLGLWLFRKPIKRRRVRVLFVVLLIEPIMYFFMGQINSLFPNRYTIFSGTDYFFHYSFVLFIFLYVGFRFPNRIKRQRMAYLFAAYVVMTALTAIFWFNTIAYGRLIYLTFPFLALFLNNTKYFFKEKWMTYLIIFLMLGVGIYFYSAESVIETLS